MQDSMRSKMWPVSAGSSTGAARVGDVASNVGGLAIGLVAQGIDETAAVMDSHGFGSGASGAILLTWSSRFAARHRRDVVTGCLGKRRGEGSSAVIVGSVVAIFHLAVDDPVDPSTATVIVLISQDPFVGRNCRRQRYSVGCRVTGRRLGGGVYGRAVAGVGRLTVVVGGALCVSLGSAENACLAEGTLCFPEGIVKGGLAGGGDAVELVVGGSASDRWDGRVGGRRGYVGRSGVGLGCGGFSS